MLYCMLYDIRMVTLCNYIEMILNSLQVLENVVFVICKKMHVLTPMSLQVLQSVRTQFIENHGTKFP